MAENTQIVPRLDIEPHKDQASIFVSKSSNILKCLSLNFFKSTNLFF